MNLSYSDTKIIEEIKEMYNNMTLTELLGEQNLVEYINDGKKLYHTQELLRDILRQITEEKLR